MCEIKEGEIGTLLKGGLVRLRDGSVYHLKDCSFGVGGRLVLSVSMPKPIFKKKIEVEGASNLEGVPISLIDTQLSVKEIPTFVISEHVLVASEPEPPLEIESTLLGGLSIGLAFLFKKVTGLDRELKAGSCEIRHQEAITRIAKLEGKVLRKQIVDGAKFVKSKIDERKETSDD